jgi:16S rRNA (cytosine967-C5)-methyltransferase
VTPAARLAAAAEVLDRISVSRGSAEQVLKSWGQSNRYAGSKDRRAIADRVYRCLRNRARLAWAGGGESGRTLVLFSLALLDALPLQDIEALYASGGYGPEPLDEDERARLSGVPGAPPAWVSAGLPDFVAEDFQRRFGEDWAAEAEGLMAPRAPIDLRVNSMRGGRDEALAAVAAEALSPEPAPLSAWGLRLPAEPPPDVQKLAAFRDGRVEIQDEGSQIAAWLARAALGETVVDFCAGGGGKTLALAQDMAAEGRLIACDVEASRIEAIRPRLARAGLSADLRVLGADGEGVEDLRGAADLVFVDAPCSGSGTWRRRPETGLAADARGGGAAARAAGGHSRSRGAAGEAGRPARLCDLFDPRPRERGERRRLRGRSPRFRGCSDPGGARDDGPDRRGAGAPCGAGGRGPYAPADAAPDPDGRLLHRPVQTDGMTAQTSTAHERVLIIDFGSQVTQLIARRVRESGVYCEIVPYDRAEAILDDFSPQAVILSGGPSSVAEAKARASAPRCSSWACRCWASATASS